MYCDQRRDTSKHDNHNRLTRKKHGQSDPQPHHCQRSNLVRSRHLPFFVVTEILSKNPMVIQVRVHSIRASRKTRSRSKKEWRGRQQRHHYAYRPKHKEHRSQPDQDSLEDSHTPTVGQPGLTSYA